MYLCVHYGTCILISNNNLLFFRYETEVFTEWTQGVDEVAKTNLDKPLIVRDPSSLQISVNFDPKVCPKLSSVVQFSSFFELCILENSPQ